jgi:acyl carrier protein
MESILIDRVRSLLAEVLSVPLEEIPPDLAFGDLPQWDSMGHMNVMISLEERFGVEVSAETISELVSISAICGYLAEKVQNG